MAWGTVALATIIQESSAQWGSGRKVTDSVWYRQYFVSERTAETGYTAAGAAARRDVLTAGDLDEYRDIQVQRIGMSGQYWVVYVKVTASWVVDPNPPA